MHPGQAGAGLAAALLRRRQQTAGDPTNACRCDHKVIPGTIGGTHAPDITPLLMVFIEKLVDGPPPWTWHHPCTPGLFSVCPLVDILNRVDIRTCCGSDREPGFFPVCLLVDVLHGIRVWINSLPCRLYSLGSFCPGSFPVVRLLISSIAFVCGSNGGRTLVHALACPLGCFPLARLLVSLIVFV